MNFLSKLRYPGVGSWSLPGNSPPRLPARRKGLRSQRLPAARRQAAACATRRVAEGASTTLQSLRPLSWYKKVNPHEHATNSKGVTHLPFPQRSAVTSEMYRVSALLACLASASAFAPAAFLPRTGTRGRFCSTSGGTFVSARSPRIVAPGSRRLCCDAFCVASSRCQGRWPPHADERGDPFP